MATCDGTLRTECNVVVHRCDDTFKRKYRVRRVVFFSIWMKERIKGGGEKKRRFQSTVQEPYRE